MSKNIKKPANGYISAKNGLFKSLKIPQKHPKNRFTAWWKYQWNLPHFFHFLKNTKKFPKFSTFRKSKIFNFFKNVVNSPGYFHHFSPFLTLSVGFFGENGGIFIENQSFFFQFPPTFYLKTLIFPPFLTLSVGFLPKIIKNFVQFIV